MAIHTKYPGIGHGVPMGAALFLTVCNYALIMANADELLTL
jgi:hypothetical protein